MTRTFSGRRTSRVLSWALSAGFGAVLPAFTSFGLAPVLVAMVGVIALAVRHAGIVGLSGVLTGFGACWTLLLARAVVSGGVLDNLGFWLAVGIVPAATGLALLVVAGRRG